MGDLRSNMTNKEWADEERKDKLDRENGRPESILLYLGVWDKSCEELIKMKEALTPFYDDYALKILDEWIKWRTFLKNNPEYK